MKIREIVLDTETTGLDVDTGDRIIEIGCVELVDFVITGRVFHKYINPGRDISAAATRIHGITSEMLADKPKFKEIAGELLDFIQDSRLVIHNARFDLRFLEVEIELVSKELTVSNPVVDTLEVARKKFPGMPASLDALCKRFNIPTHDRKLHGALKDAMLLARVYVELLEASQRRFTFKQEKKSKDTQHNIESEVASLRKDRFFSVTEEELILHRQSLQKVKDPIWHLYIGNEN